MKTAVPFEIIVPITSARICRSTDLHWAACSLRSVYPEQVSCDDIRRGPRLLELPRNSIRLFTCRCHKELFNARSVDDDTFHLGVGHLNRVERWLSASDLISPSSLPYPYLKQRENSRVKMSEVTRPVIKDVTGMRDHRRYRIFVSAHFKDAVNARNSKPGICARR